MFKGLRVFQKLGGPFEGVMRSVLGSMGVCRK